MKLYLLLSAFFLLPLVLVAQEADSALFSPVADTLSLQRVFEDVEPLLVTMKYDISSFVRRKNKSEYLDAELTVVSESFEKTKDIRLKARGNFRKNHCFFPPIYLNFKSDPIEGSELEGIKKIKLITHCQVSSANTNYILREYLAYKMFNVLTDYSFRVRLLDVNYIDTGKKGRHYQKYAVVIEPIELVASRNASIEIDGHFASHANIIADRADVVAMFQYMIANTDFRFKGGHNMKYLKTITDINQQMTPVPYDFDFAGMVGAFYAAPQEWADVESIDDRVYLGYCRPEEAFREVVGLFLDHKEELLSVVREFEYLSERERNATLRYLDGFFYEIESVNRFVFRLEAECRDDSF